MKSKNPIPGIRKFEVVMKAQEAEAEIYLYDAIGEFWGEGISAKMFADQFNALCDKPKMSRIVLRVNSPGGDVFDGSAMYTLVSQSKVPVDVMVDGLAASAAFTVAMAGRSIAISEAGMMMCHNAKGFVGGGAADMRDTADILEKISTQMAEIYAKKCGMSLDQVKQLMTDETWMTAKECVDMGFADTLVETEPDEDDKTAAVAAAFDLSKFKHVPDALQARIAAYVDKNKPQAKSSVVEDRQKVLDDLLAAALTSSAPSQENTATADKGEKVMSNETKTTPAAAAVEVDNYSEVSSQIAALCNEFNCADKIPQLLKEKTTLVEAQMFVTSIVLARAKRHAEETPAGLAQPTVAGLTTEERRDYSVVRAIRALSKESGIDARLEREVSDDIAKRIGRSTPGMFIPTNLNPFRPLMTGLDSKTSAAGKYTVATEVRDLIELLRNKARVIQMGATVLGGLQGNLQFPTQSSAGTFVWTGENPGSDVTQADAVFGARTMSPKTGQATTAFSRQLLAQSTVDIENFVREDLAKIHALAIDAAAIKGTGNSNQPLGILGTGSVGSVACGTAAGAKPTYANVVDLETSIATANADEDGMRFLTTPGMRGVLKKVGKLDSTYASIPLWDQWGNAPGIGDLIGYQAFVSNQVPSTLTKGSSSGICHAIIFGYWPTVVIGEWGVLELVVDPYTLKKQGMIEVTSFQMVDVMLRHPEQMAAIQDALTS